MSEPDITCREMVEIMTEYLEGGMAAHDRARFESHLATCEGCTTVLRQLETTIRIAGHLSEEDIPEDQRDGLLAAFRGWRDRSS
jgi:anti-sigma factor RsiW